MYTFPFNFFRYSKTAVIGTLILVLCLLPSSEFNQLQMPITFADSIVHFIMFFAFSGALYLDLTRQKKITLNTLFLFLIVFGVSFFLAALTEILQSVFVPLHREGSFSDLGFDVLGTIAGFFTIRAIKRKFRPGL